MQDPSRSQSPECRGRHQHARQMFGQVHCKWLLTQGQTHLQCVRVGLRGTQGPGSCARWRYWRRDQHARDDCNRAAQRGHGQPRWPHQRLLLALHSSSGLSPARSLASRCACEAPNMHAILGSTRAWRCGSASHQDGVWSCILRVHCVSCTEKPHLRLAGWRCCQSWGR